jgi:hypothetical protein
MRMSGDVAKQLGDGYRDTAALQKLARQTDDMLGKYQRFSPTLRRLSQSIMPFVPWFLAAARFVFWTMPVHNTAKTALLIKLSQVNQQAFQDAHADVPPGSLKLAIPNGKGGFVDLARYTPYGLSGPIAEGDVGTVTDPLLPQISGVVHALNKQDPFGRGLQVNPATGITRASRPAASSRGSSRTRPRSRSCRSSLRSAGSGRAAGRRTPTRTSSARRPSRAARTSARSAGPWTRSARRTCAAGRRQRRRRPLAAARSTASSVTGCPGRRPRNATGSSTRSSRTGSGGPPPSGRAVADRSRARSGRR